LSPGGAVHELASRAGAVCARHRGLSGDIELALIDAPPGQHGALVLLGAFDHGLHTRTPGDTRVLAPRSPDDIRNTVDRLASTIQACACSPETDA
jgi:hypothetical protein